MEKPNPKLYGWQEPTPDDPGGWMLEGGEDEYSNALSAYFESLDIGFNDYNGSGEVGLTCEQISQILLDRGWKKYGDMQFIKGCSILHLYRNRLRFWEDLRAASVVCGFDLPISESDFNNLIPAPFWCMDEGDGKPRCKVQCPFCENLC